ncbi:Glycosylphosphatidylinositol (GPI) anchor assembly protein [Recurvomyces mirabilis]|nr:Glycosylphosphatidylinositol (GPI) anchor assembly protein [Recurvomyces mirabilis]
MSTPVTPVAAPAAQPISILSTQSALFFANLQPILLLGTLLFNFRSLVADPVGTLLGLAPTIAIVQTLYCVICLPIAAQVEEAGRKAASKTGAGVGVKKKSTKTAQDPDIWAKLVPAFLSMTLTLVLSTPLLYIFTVLFGAPLMTHNAHTLLLALHLALLVTPHLYYVHGLDAQTWLRVASLQLPLDETYGLSLGALAGAWMGAVPIPLDWDREWQKWPVTVVIGMYIGAVVGKLLGGYVVKGWRIKLS